MPLLSPFRRALYPPHERGVSLGSSYGIIAHMKIRVSLLMGVVALVSSVVLANPKNVILFIGDGMSTPQRMTADEFARKAGLPPLALNRLSHEATTRTCSANSLVTDSAAAATAIACGEKTNNGTIGMDTTTNRLTSVAVIAKECGKKVGIVTSVTINHATPAGFFGHRKSRGEGYGLGLDLLASGFDYFAGGGLFGHDDRRHREYRGDIYALAKEAGYTFAKCDRAAFDALKPGSGKVWYVAAESCLPYAIDAKDWKDTPTLAELTAKGIELLDNPHGFFMMVEGGKIDWAGHANDAATNLRDVLALDEAVRVALDFKAKNPNTLIVVTGDHETGGMTMGFGGTGYAFYMERLANQKCSADSLSYYIRTRKPTAFDELKPFLSENFGFKFEGSGASDPMVLTSVEKDELQRAFEHDLKLAKAGKKDNEAYDATKITRLPTAVKNVLSHKCGIGWTSGAHTALPVLTTAEGPGADRFFGFLDNTDIAKILKDLVK